MKLLTLFKAFCQSFLCSAVGGLLADYTQNALNALQVQYNINFEDVGTITMFAQSGVDYFIAVMRK